MAPKQTKKTTGKAKAPASGRRSTLPPPDPAVAALLEEALGGRKELRRGKMFGCPGFFLGKKAVAVVFGNDLNVTLPPAEVERLTAPGPASGFRPFEVMGRRMSGWMLVDIERLMRLGSDAAIFDDAIAYARSKAEKPARR